MNNIKTIFKNYSNRYLLVILILVVLCPIIILSYSAFVFNTSDYRASEMMIGNLLYSMEIDNEATSSVVVPKNSSKEVIIKVTNLNSISNKYKLIYETINNVVVNYASDENEPVKGSISTIRTFSIAITNNNSSSVTINFNITGGYNQNDVDDINILTGYTEVENTYVKYDMKLLSLYVDDVLVSSLDSTKKYYLKNSICYDEAGNVLSGVNATWNSQTNTASISQITQTTKCKLYLSTFTSQMQAWQYWVSLSGINYSSYASLNAFMGDATALTTVSNSTQSMQYLITNSTLISEIKATSNYLVNFKIILDGTGITDVEKYNAGLPVYLYNYGKVNYDVAGYITGTHVAAEFGKVSGLRECDT